MDFLTFKKLVSLDVLIVFYYLGAIAMPIAAYMMLRVVLRKWPMLGTALIEGKRMVWNGLLARHKVLVVVGFVVSFLFMELIWRMMFEFLIAYLQMRDALVNPTG